MLVKGFSASGNFLHLGRRISDVKKAVNRLVKLNQPPECDLPADFTSFSAVIMEWSIAHTI